MFNPANRFFIKIFIAFPHAQGFGTRPGALALPTGVFLFGSVRATNKVRLNFVVCIHMALVACEAVIIPKQMYLLTLLCRQAFS